MVDGGWRDLSPGEFELQTDHHSKSTYRNVKSAPERGPWERTQIEKR